MGRMDALLLDLDGTLIDPLDGIASSLAAAFAEMGLDAPAPSEVRAVIGPPLRRGIRSLLPAPSDELVEEAVRRYREHYGRSGLERCALYPGVSEALDRAREDGFRCFMVTSKPAVFARRIADLKGIARRFEGVFGSELDGRFDDKRALLAHVLATAGLDPARSVMVGDRLEDLAAARASGVRFLGVTYGYGTVGDFAAAGAPDLCDSASGIPGLARRLLGHPGHLPGRVTV